MVRIDRLHSDLPKSAAYSALSAEAQRFVSDLDLMALSRAFQ
jgi:hypothetical protein